MADFQTGSSRFLRVLKNFHPDIIAYYFRVDPVGIENLVHEIILPLYLLQDSNAGSLNNKSNALKPNYF